MNGIQGVPGQRILRSQVTKKQKEVKEPELKSSRDCYIPSTGNNLKLDTQGTIDHLTELLKKDKSFMSDISRDFMTHPIGRDLATAMILADPDLQEQIAKNMWRDIAQSNVWSSINPDHYGQPLYLPPDYHGYNIEEMLLQPNVKPEDRNQHEIDQVFFKYYGILNEKAKTSGLTDTERLLSASLERAEKAANRSFDEKLEWVKNTIGEEFFDHNKEYTFSFDSSTFTFSVSGGTTEENEKIEQTISSRSDMIQTALAALRDDKSVSKPFAEKMGSIFHSYQVQYEQKRVEKYLDKIISIPAPEFKEVVFTFENGEFKIANGLQTTP